MNRIRVNTLVGLACCLGFHVIATSLLCVGCGAAAPQFSGVRALNGEERANLDIAVDQLRNVYRVSDPSIARYADMGKAIDDARFHVVDSIEGAEGELWGYARGRDVYLKATLFGAGMNLLIEYVGHELAHTLGADEAQARRVQADIARVLFNQPAHGVAQ